MSVYVNSITKKQIDWNGCWKCVLLWQRRNAENDCYHVSESIVRCSANQIGVQVALRKNKDDKSIMRNHGIEYE